MLTDDERDTIQQAANMLDVLRVLDMHQHGYVNDALTECRDAQREMARKLRAIAAPRVATVGDRPRPQCPTHGDTVSCYCTTGALHCHDCGHTPPFCTACDEYHDAATGCPSTRGPIGEG